MRVSEKMIGCADLLIERYKIHVRKGWAMIFIFSFTIFLVSCIFNMPNAIIPGIGVSVFISASYLISRQFADISEIRCPDCGGRLSFRSTDNGVLMLTCRNHKITYKTDCMYRYQGAPPEKIISSSQ